MKAVFALPLLTLALAAEILSAVFVVFLCAFFTLLMVLATPFWVLELLRARTCSLVRVSPLRACESYLGWVYSPTSGQTQAKDIDFVRLWGFEFCYVAKA